jgi:hypothetical protein
MPIDTVLSELLPGVVNQHKTKQVVVIGFADALCWNRLFWVCEALNSTRQSKFLACYYQRLDLSTGDATSMLKV